MIKNDKGMITVTGNELLIIYEFETLVTQIYNIIKDTKGEKFADTMLDGIVKTARATDEEKEKIAKEAKDRLINDDEMKRFKEFFEKVFE